MIVKNKKTFNNTNKEYHKKNNDVKNINFGIGEELYEKSKYKVFIW